MPDSQQSLFAQLAKTSDDRLAGRVSDVDELSEEDKDLAHKERRDDYNLNKHLKRIKLVASWAAAISLGAFVCSFIAAFIYLFYLFIQSESADPLTIKTLLKNWLDYILIVMATLFVQNIFGKKR